MGNIVEWWKSRICSLRVGWDQKRAKRRADLWLDRVWWWPDNLISTLYQPVNESVYFKQCDICCLCTNTFLCRASYPAVKTERILRSSSLLKGIKRQRRCLYVVIWTELHTCIHNNKLIFSTWLCCNNNSFSCTKSGDECAPLAILYEVDFGKHYLIWIIL